MVCSNCGEELKEGSVYCSRCGQEAQIVSDINILEDEFLRDLMDEQLRPESDTEKTEDSEQEVLEEKERIRHKEERNREKRKKKYKRMLFTLLVILAVALLSVFSAVRYRHNHSADYLLTKAEEAYTQKNYQNAQTFLDKLFAFDADNIEGLLLSARIDVAQKEYDTAETLYMQVLTLDQNNYEAYEGLIEVYDILGRTDLILALMDDVSDADLLALFEDYIIPTPEFSVESGSYSEYFTVDITAEKSLQIYYTLDGSTPDTTDTLYTDPIEISEQGTIMLTAVCADADGNLSEPVSAVYKVTLNPPEAPTVSPDGGQFTSPETITVSVPSGVTVYYTWDNTTPTTSSDKYTGPLEMPEGNHILSLIAVDEYGMVSDVVKYNYIYYPEESDDTQETNETDVSETSE